MEFLSVCLQSPCELYFESIQIFIEICTKFDRVTDPFPLRICCLYPQTSLAQLICGPEMPFLSKGLPYEALPLTIFFLPFEGS